MSKAQIDMVGHQPLSASRKVLLVVWATAVIGGMGLLVANPSARSEFILRLALAIAIAMSGIRQILSPWVRTGLDPVRDATRIAKAKQSSRMWGIASLMVGTVLATLNIYRFFSE